MSEILKFLNRSNPCAEGKAWALEQVKLHKLTEVNELWYCPSLRHDWRVWMFGKAVADTVFAEFVKNCISKAPDYNSSPKLVKLLTSNVLIKSEAMWACGETTRLHWVERRKWAEMQKIPAPMTKMEVFKACLLAAQSEEVRQMNEMLKILPLYPSLYI